jgi:hypothetical protein
MEKKGSCSNFSDWFIAAFFLAWHLSLFRFVVLPSSTYSFTLGVEGVYFHLITLSHTPQSVGLLWKKDRPAAETST